MNKMKKVNELPALAQTLFIPLAVRAKEAECNRPLFVDKMAINIFNQCDTDNMIIDGGEISTHGILARTQVIDTEVERLLSANPNAIVINLGAGLDTRFFRLDNGTVQWYDLDLPEVIALRKQFIAENERLHFVAKSVMDYSWIDEIEYSSNDTIILIAEGLLMYFAENDVNEILNILIKKFPKADMFFDVVHSFFIGKKISSGFLWGISRAKELESMNNELSIIQAWSTGSLIKQRQPLIFRVLNVFPSTKNRSQIIHLKIEKRG